MNWFDKIVAKIGLDKIAHMFGIAYIATIMALVFWKITPDFSSWVYAVCGFAFVVFVIVLKELLDFFCNKPFDTHDVAWGMVGNLFSFFIIGFIL